MFSIPSDPVCVNEHVRAPEALRAARHAAKHRAHGTGLCYEGLLSTAGLSQPPDNQPAVLPCLTRAICQPATHIWDSLYPTRVQSKTVAAKLLSDVHVGSLKPASSHTTIWCTIGYIILLEAISRGQLVSWQHIFLILQKKSGLMK